MQKNFYIGFFCQYVLLCVIFIVLYHVNICHALLNRLDFFLINKHLFMPHICSACTFTDIKQKNSLFLFKAISYMNSFFVLLLAENILNCCRKVTAQGNYWLCFKSIIFTCYYTKELTSCFFKWSRSTVTSSSDHNVWYRTKLCFKGSVFMQTQCYYFC